MTRHDSPQPRPHAATFPAVVPAGVAGWALLACLLGAQAAAPASAQSGGTRWLNDTGQTSCVDASGPLPCAGTGQDGESGRDVTAPNPRDGRAGFAFVKVSDTGADLPASATAWSCVRDRVSGLMWEVKTADGGPRDVSRTYTQWGDGRAGDASAFVADVNTAGLCGHTDWRLPSRLELQSLVDYGRPFPGPTIDTAWFPNTSPAAHWTGSAYTGVSPDAWFVLFGDGLVGSYPRSARYAVRVVRAARPVGAVADRFVANGDEVTDRLTRLVWRRCSEGQTWTGSTCSGNAASYTWKRALDRARAAAAGGTAWRLPNAKELASLVDDTRVEPAIDTTAFPGTPGVRYWTSTPYAGPEAYAWLANFNFGPTTNFFRSSAYAVRLVRSGP